MNQAQKDYTHLHTLARHTRVLQGISSLISWDQETYMPEGSNPIRAEQLKTLAGLIHHEKTCRSFAKALEKLIDLKTGKVDAKGLKPEQKAALREWRRDFLHDTALPKKFVEEFVHLTSRAHVIWREARAKNNFKEFAPILKQIIEMNRKKAEYFGYTHHPYDALLDEYEPEMTTRDVEKVFTPLRTHISGFLKKLAKKKEIDNRFLFGKFSEKKQLSFGKEVLDAMEFDSTYGRLDISTHPFSESSHPTDSRITTRFHKTGLMSCLLSIIHEGGHSLYEMGLPQEAYGSPLGDAISLGIHESQSRWWETRIGLCQPFWKHFYPKLKRAFPGKFDRISLPKFYQAINKVKPSLIRVEADEVTYSLHVIVRFELEKALIEGSLSVDALPEAWNNKVHELLGITPKSDSEGCLQDIHWSLGAFGYFPTYALGNLFAAHFFEAFAKQYPTWEKEVATGNLGFIREWLRENIHKHGRRYTSKELLKKVTGKPFSSDAYLRYLNQKFGV